MDQFEHDSNALPVPADQVGLKDLWAPSTTALVAVRDLGKSLEANGIISAAQLATARGVAEKTPGKPLADIFFDMGVDEVELQQTLASISHMAFERIDPQNLEAAKFINRLTLSYCQEHGVMPLRYAGSRLVVGVVHVDDLVLLDELRHKIGQSIKPVVVTRSDIDAVAEALKSDESEDNSVSMDDVLEGIDEDDVEVVEENNDDLDLEKMAGESPVIRYVNYLIFNAVKEGASDIHIEPQEKKIRVRYRIDGVMFDATNPPNQMRSAIISRIKIMANLDIAERRLPQDGRIRAMVHGRKLDLRVSTLPMVQGEKCVMRILDTRSIQVDLDDLGMDQDSLQIWKHQISQPHGIVLVTGPTGSGKTTTLYASLGKMDRDKLNISTAEDPVEYHLSGINQTQTHASIGMTFAAALRALLRQDPDVIMVGEVRDVETAKTAIEASLTGHLVLSTLHTNDAPSAITRLINIGVEPYLIGSAVNGVLAQRLVRKICSNCKTQTVPDDVIAEHLAMQGIAMDQVWTGAGCDKCRGTGYSGRLGIYEMLVLNDNLRDRVAGNPNVTEFRRMCVEGGMVTLREDGFRKVANGLTTVDEVLRVTES
ncbi:GspE/PulE family protein [Algisphaera agarilytica]|uniref:Type IV pilus assembly protein PilB n=1 Tax=Algisphaera agarilytica TaxID=1385975 RepID=A0A7X0H8M9_9BACT|nr:GspE/PulE family protein [Algisphaera agarilytica]MBB6431322.1 type IV pilus assembly protein PilB [Algisphaera agarilytica]